jgi:branched-chain amino acid transport system permease protein
MDLDAAKLMGINIYRIYALSFGLGAMLAGLAGSLISLIYTITPFMGLPYLIIAFIVTVLGGMGNILGSLIGGFILGILGSFITYYQPGLVMVAFYLIFLLILIVRPTGILGK